jgi:predicted phage terminase large subunit-like protein
MKRIHNKDVQREIGLRGSLHDFIKLAWPIVEPSIPFIDGWHIGAMCEHLEACHRREIRRLVVNVPPGTMKSMCVSVFWNVWSWIRDPSTRWMAASYDASLTLRDNRKVLLIIRSEWFRERWGDRVFVGPQVAEGNFSNHKKGERFATSIEGKNTGRHFDFKIIDDPLKPADLSKTSLDTCTEWAKNTLVSRVKPGATPTDVTVCIMQRLHENDLAGHFLRQGYEGLVLPMRFEEQRRCKTSIFLDPRTTEGELLWPQGKSEAAVVELETSMGSRVAAAQLQQFPVPDGGQIFKRDWFKYAKILGRPDKFDQMIQSWDLAFKDGDGSDYVVGQVWGRKGGEFYLLDQVKERMNAPATCEAIRMMRRKWPRATAILVEDKANGPAVISMLRKSVSGIIEVNPKGGKVARANAVSPMFEAGNVYLPDPEESGWVDGFATEMCMFPVGANDDQVDACTQALCYLQERSNRLAQAMARVQANGGASKVFG